ncbi:hypothetical protein BpHYR1_021848 [Brachionus plicatilis]|uniref:Uncharacterized protein n=1 Tax=Brachionus plicatilis TaxID=10195 RepID=A0A3M7T4J6_BRAPC|nr:hypothetical protein BpHYR1_021848 [Brachionus plicatilis]
MLSVVKKKIIEEGYTKALSIFSLLKEYEDLKLFTTSSMTRLICIPYILKINSKYHFNTKIIIMKRSIFLQTFLDLFIF